ncbi:MAG: AtpZ/AtpI family protein [Acidobacteriota bacterium]
MAKTITLRLSGEKKKIVFMIAAEPRQKSYYNPVEEKLEVEYYRGNFYVMNEGKNNKELKNKKKPRIDWRLLEYSSVGLMFPVSIAVGLAIGYFLDSILNTSPWLLLIFTILGIIAGFYNVYKIAGKE